MANDATYHDTYYQTANKALEDLLDMIEQRDAEDIYDAEYNNGIMNISDDEGRGFVVNLHSASQKIWYSSPISGTSYFVNNRSGGVTQGDNSHGNAEWINGNGDEMVALILDELLLA